MPSPISSPSIWCTHFALLLQELHTDGPTDGDVLAGVGERASILVATEHLNLIAVAAATEQELAVGRDVELAGMSGGGLMADACEQASRRVDARRLSAVSARTDGTRDRLVFPSG